MVREWLVVGGFEGLDGSFVVGLVGFGFFV